MAEQRDRPIVIDPTANVLSLVAEAIKRQDDLRSQDKEAQKELAAAEYKRIDANFLAESRRIDALFAKSDAAVALASEKAATQAAALAVQVATAATATATLISSMRDAMDKRIQLVETNQSQAGGMNQQRSEGRKDNQWVIGLIVIIGIAIATFLGKALFGK